MSVAGATQANLNLRDAPNTQATVLELLPEGAQITVVSSSDTSGWLFIRTSDGKTGYVSSAYITTKLLTPNTPPGHALNIRSAPEVVTSPDNRIEQANSGDILVPLEPDSVVTAKVGTTETQNQWIKVYTPSGKTGYIAAWYVLYLTPPPTQTPTQPAPQPPQQQ